MAIYLGNTPIAENVTIQQGGGVTIDDTLSDTSENPVQNKVINAALNSKADLSDIPTTLPANGGNADTLDGLHANEIASNPNLLINPNFKINQRGLTEYKGYSGYTVDMWKTIDENTEVTLTDNGLKVKRSIPIFRAQVYQNIENFADFRGKTCTISANISELTALAASLMVVVTSPNNTDHIVKDITSIGTISETFQVPNDITAMSIYLTGENDIEEANLDNYTIFQWVKLELGNIATPFCPPNHATELLKIQAMDGTIPADTVDGKHASDFALKTDIPTTLPANGGRSDSTNHQINHYLGQGIDVLTYAASDNCPYNVNTKVRIMNCPTCPTNYGYNAAENDFWYDIYKLDNLWVQIKAYDVRENAEFINSCCNGTWKGWIRCNDGGNAATVNGYTVNANVPAGFSPDNMMSKNNPTGTGSFSLNRKADTTIGNYSFAEGSETTASGNFSHAEGAGTTASGGYSHAEGEGTTASQDASHAEGSYTIASGMTSHAEGDSTTASNYSSHAEGSYTTASGNASHAEGFFTTASNYASHAEGKYNATMTTGGSTNNTTGTAFVIGNGTGSSALSNAFSVQYSGIVKAKSTITASTTADYAEFFEWLDGNPDNEDRVGYFVTLDGDKIRIATTADDYILGVVSGEPFVLGNGDCDTWNGMYLHDEFRRTIYEPAPKMIEILDSDGNPTGEYEEVEGEFEGTRPKLNPEYDHTQPYISRLDRKEWAPVGMLGVLAVRHDGTAQVNGYVTVNANGIATACEKNAENAYRVIKSNTDSVVEIIFR